MNDKKKGIGFSYAWNGLKYVILHERNFKIHLIIALLVLITSFLLNLKRSEWIFILIAIVLVLAAEMINTAIELLMDYVKPEINPIAKLIKDIMAGAVLLTAFLAAIIGILIFVPKIIQLIY